MARTGKCAVNQRASANLGRKVRCRPLGSDPPQPASHVERVTRSATTARDATATPDGAREADREKRWTGSRRCFATDHGHPELAPRPGDSRVNSRRPFQRRTGTQSHGHQSIRGLSTSGGNIAQGTTQRFPTHPLRRGVRCEMHALDHAIRLQQLPAFAFGGPDDSAIVQPRTDCDTLRATCGGQLRQQHRHQPVFSVTAEHGKHYPFEPP